MLGRRIVFIGALPGAVLRGGWKAGFFAETWAGALLAVVLPMVVDWRDMVVGWLVFSLEVGRLSYKEQKRSKTETFEGTTVGSERV